jgi:hypothetical protein
MKVLLLPVSKQPFICLCNDKNNEYRVNDPDTNWIKSRLIDSKTGKDKHYDVVKLPNGYGKVPYVIRTFLGYKIAKKNYKVKYKNGFEVEVKKGTYNILLGAIVKTGNVESKELF